MRLKEFVTEGARFFLKSEYGPLSPEWPVVAFSQTSFESQIRREYRTGRDFVVYLGTKGEENPLATDRGALLSVAEIDLTRTFETYAHISPDARKWAEKHYPGQWMRCFRVTKGFDLPARPVAADLFSQTDLRMWHVPFREIEQQDRLRLLELDAIALEDLDILKRSGRELDQSDLLRPEHRALSQEAIRLAELIINRVDASGEMQQRRAPIRSAPQTYKFRF